MIEILLPRIARQAAVYRIERFELDEGFQLYHPPFRVLGLEAAARVDPDPDGERLIGGLLRRHAQSARQARDLCGVGGVITKHNSSRSRSRSSNSSSSSNNNDNNNAHTYELKLLLLSSLLSLLSLLVIVFLLSSLLLLFFCGSGGGSPPAREVNLNLLALFSIQYSIV